ncbi:MAG: helix-turn-helix domain-containing protein [Bacteroidota bacterium]
MSEYNPQKLREIRTTLNLKQDQMASKAGLSQRDISLLENGKKEFIPTRYMRFLNRAGINLNWLFADEAPNEAMQSEFAPSVRMMNAKNGQGIFDKMDANITSRTVPVVTRNQLSHYPENLENQVYFEQLPHILLPPDDLPEVPTRCFQLDDDSMADTLLPFDYIVAQQIEKWQERLRPGFLYIWVTQHDILVRRLVEITEHVLRVRGDHESYPEVALVREQVHEVWQVRGRLSFQLPAHPHDLQNQLGQIRANLESIQGQLEKG